MRVAREIGENLARVGKGPFGVDPPIRLTQWRQSSAEDSNIGQPGQVSPGVSATLTTEVLVVALI